jgi:hypothetical protein
MKPKTIIRTNSVELLIGLLFFAILAQAVCNREAKERQLEPASIVGTK